ncbi:MAG: HD domain-containing protein [Chloroflexota bacterium]
MSIPGRTDAVRLLLSLDPPPWLIRHSRAVAEVAAWLGARIESVGHPVDRAAVEVAGLLHDVDKALAPDDPSAGLPHGAGSADWLARRGHPELSDLVRDHPVGRLLDPGWTDGWLASAAIEARIVAYADKRAGSRLESMDDRFAAWRRRYGGWEPDDDEIVRANAHALEADVCGLAGVSPADVRRVSWTAEALARGSVVAA